MNNRNLEYIQLLTDNFSSLKEARELKKSIQGDLEDLISKKLELKRMINDPACSAEIASRCEQLIVNAEQYIQDAQAQLTRVNKLIDDFVGYVNDASIDKPS